MEKKRSAAVWPSPPSSKVTLLTVSRGAQALETALLLPKHLARQPPTLTPRAPCFRSRALGKWCQKGAQCEPEYRTTAHATSPQRPPVCRTPSRVTTEGACPATERVSSLPRPAERLRHGAARHCCLGGTGLREGLKPSGWGASSTGTRGARCPGPCSRHCSALPLETEWIRHSREEAGVSAPLRW